MTIQDFITLIHGLSLKSNSAGMMAALSRVRESRFWF